MPNLFGTDGIRGPANQYPLIPEFLTQIGHVLAETLCEKKYGPIVIGMDTRASGDMLETALASGIFSAGVNAIPAGIIPTPGVACLVPRLQAAGGVVISASHNPYYDNGIKIFDARGHKIEPQVEAEVEQRLAVFSKSPRKISGMEPGRWIRPAGLIQIYIDFLKRSLKPGFSGHGITAVLDCSNGATYDIAPRLLDALGVCAHVLAAQPNGRNINHDCGSEHPQALAQSVVAQGAMLGLAFDGDGDRLIAVDETGKIIRGDKLLLIFAEHFQNDGRLANNCVVSTVMSNMGLSVALKSRGIFHHITDVGDRQVLVGMQSSGAVLGGEDSGHIILADRHSTGDGLLSALQLLEVLVASGTPLSELSGKMSVYPQILMNVQVNRKPDLAKIPALQEVISRIDHALQDRGRVLVRYSGTQSLCRVMLEGPQEEEIQSYARTICRAIEEHIG